LDHLLRILFSTTERVALGTLPGNGKPYEAFLTAIWHVGAVNHTAGLDFAGTASGPRTVHHAVIYLALTAVFIAAACAIRIRQLRSV
jgi:hypothetical protein